RAELRETERLVQRTRRQVEAARLEQAHAELQRARRAAEALAPEPEPVPSRPSAVAPATVAPGDSVWLRGIPTPGEVLTAPDASGEFDGQLGARHTRGRLQQVERAAPGGTDAPPRTIAPPPPLSVP